MDKVEMSKRDLDWLSEHGTIVLNPPMSLCETQGSQYATVQIVSFVTLCFVTGKNFFDFSSYIYFI